MESLDLRIAEVGRDFWVYLLQPLLHKDHPEQDAQDHIQILHISKEETPQHLTNLCVCSITHVAQKTEPPMFQLCPVPLVLALDATEKSGSILCSPSSCIYAYRCNPPEPPLLQLSSPSSFSLSSQERCSRPLIIFIALCLIQSRYHQPS